MPQTQRQWIKWSLERSLAEWTNPFWNYEKVLSSVLKSMKSGFLEGPGTVMSRSRLWLEVMEKLGIDRKKLSELHTAVTGKQGTKAGRFLTKVLNLK